MFKVNNKDTRKTPMTSFCIFIVNFEHISWRRSGIFIVNFEHISHLVLVFLLVTLSMQLPAEIYFNKSMNQSMYDDLSFGGRIAGWHPISNLFCNLGKGGR